MYQDYMTGINLYRLLHFSISNFLILSTYLQPVEALTVKSYGTKIIYNYINFIQFELEDRAFLEVRPWFSTS